MSDRHMPCSVCGSATEWCCSDCAIDRRGTVYVCASPSCRDKHEASDCSRRIVRIVKDNLHHGRLSLTLHFASGKRERCSVYMGPNFGDVEWARLRDDPRALAAFLHDLNDPLTRAALAAQRGDRG